MRAILLWGMLLLVGGVITDANARSIAVTGDMPAATVQDRMAFYEDPDAQLSFERLRARAPELMQQADAMPTGLGFSRSAYWVSIELHNPSSEPVSAFVRQDYPLIDHLSVWMPDGTGGYQHWETGDRTPYDTRPIAVRDFVFPFTLAPGSTQTAYLRFKSDGPINLGLSVVSAPALLNITSSEQLLFGAYYGGFLVLVFYNLILFLAVKDSAYVYYMVYVVAYGFYMSVHNGLAFQYLWPGSPWAANQSLLLLLGISLLFGLHFSRVVCSTRRWSPGLDRVAVVLLVTTAALLLVTPFVAYQYLILAYSLLTVLVCVTILVLGTLSWLKGSVPARYFMVAWIGLMVSVLIYMGKQFGFFPHNFFTQNSFQMGSLVEMVLLSLALGARVNEMQKLGFSDALTGLANRRKFDQVLPLELEKWHQSKSSFALLVMDIDHFKRINDEHGHAVGDKVLAALGQLLRKNVRRPSLACRFGGEEFVLLLPGAGAEQAMGLAERLRVLVSTKPLAEVNVTVSIGVAVCDSFAMTRSGALFEAADTALYAAKQAGRNQCLLYELPTEERRLVEAV
ncbi:diguanylate cyclase [Simiduia agarivorans]|uniref:diguanylate cyclase n=1 Tax=Simiduia agarivorans (strain DSM 21679 / JCM 13881 / BCRC 17597 / SA1) TaxID=1117647 RepID=R9S3I7_SIMAS|nr:diguanylate cyclase [Simiduia agarivorans]AGN11362.1 response regulator [Simiduia agarivorans SA1 = DSM 21679]